MKGFTVAAAAAVGLAGAASAASLHQKHEHLHRRQDWGAWSSSADPTTAYSTSGWGIGEWDPTSTSSVEEIDTTVTIWGADPTGSGWEPESTIAMVYATSSASGEAPDTTITVWGTDPTDSAWEPETTMTVYGTESASSSDTWTAVDWSTWGAWSSSSSSTEESAVTLTVWGTDPGAEDWAPSTTITISGTPTGVGYSTLTVWETPSTGYEWVPETTVTFYSTETTSTTEESAVTLTVWGTDPGAEDWAPSTTITISGTPTGDGYSTLTVWETPSTGYEWVPETTVTFYSAETTSTTETSWSYDPTETSWSYDPTETWSYDPTETAWSYSTSTFETTIWSSDPSATGWSEDPSSSSWVVESTVTVSPVPSGEWSADPTTWATTSVFGLGEWSAVSTSTVSAAAASSSSWGAWDTTVSADPASSSDWAWTSADPDTCSAYVVTMYGDPTWVPDPPLATSYTTVTVVPTAPYPTYTWYTETGVYTIWGTTMTLNSTVTAPAPTTTSLTSGWNTYGGVTTIVTEETTVTVEYATVTVDSTSGTATILAETIYTAVTAGTYTIEAWTTSVWDPAVTVYPIVMTWAPGVYVQVETIITVIETETFFYCPFESATAWATATTSWAEATTSTEPTYSAPAGTGHAAISPAGSRWSMTYSPYTSSGGCKDQGTISYDIGVIASKGFTSVRVYSTDCSTLEYVGAAASSNGLKMIIGIWISDTGISGAEDQVTEIMSWAQWDIVELIVVGNEAVFNGYCSAGDLSGFIGSVKSQASAKGYTGPVTTTEPLSTWQESGSEWCGTVDVLAANLYAFFNAQTTASEAGPFIQSEITVLEGICPGKAAYVMETGWPHSGDCNGAACPGVSEQATAINSIESVVGAQVVFFTYEDDEWKDPGQFDVEQYWGCVDVFSNA